MCLTILWVAPIKEWRMRLRLLDLGWETSKHFLYPPFHAFGCAYVQPICDVNNRLFWVGFCWLVPHIILPFGRIKCSALGEARGLMQTAVAVVCGNDSQGPGTGASRARRAGADRYSETQLWHSPAGELSEAPYGGREKWERQDSRESYGEDRGSPPQSVSRSLSPFKSTLMQEQMNKKCNDTWKYPRTKPTK